MRRWWPACNYPQLLFARQCESHFDIGQTCQASPHHHVSRRRRIVGAREITAQLRNLGHVVRKSLAPCGLCPFVFQASGPIAPFPVGLLAAKGCLYLTPYGPATVCRNERSAQVARECGIRGESRQDPALRGPANLHAGECGRSSSSPRRAPDLRPHRADSLIRATRAEYRYLRGIPIPRGKE